MPQADQPKWRRYLRFWRADVDADVDDELRFHFESRVEELVARGLTPDAARARAVDEFGDPAVVRDRLRAIDHRIEQSRRRGEWRDGLRQDVRFALRAMRRNPSFTSVAVVTLALGIGANAAIFGVVNATLIRPLPFTEPDRLVRVWPDATAMPAGVLAGIRERARTLAGLAGFSRGFDVTLTGAGTPRRLTAVRVTDNLFDVLGVPAAVGRTLLAGENVAGADRVAVISHGLWTQQFGAGADVIGRRIVVDGISREIVGVMPPRVRFPTPEARLWIPSALDPRDVGAYWGSGHLAAVGRMRAGVSFEQARADLVPAIRSTRTLFPWRMPDTWGEGGDVVLLRDSLVGGTRSTLLILLGAVGLLLLVSCVNVANLLLARAAARGREIAIRGALGAGRGRLIRQFLTESLLLALAGAGAGLLLARWTLGALVALLPPEVPRVADFGIDTTVLLFASALAVGTGLLFGLAPAARASRPDLRSALVEGRRFRGASGHGGNLPRTLVVAQVALAVVLVAGAALLIKSAWRLHAVDPGFRTEHAVAAEIPIPSFAGDSVARARDFYDAVVARAESLRGVTAAAVTSHLPFSGRIASSAVDVEVHPTAPGAEAPMIEMVSVTADYLRAMGIPLIGGRPLTEADRETTPWVAVIDETAARRFWPAENPIGKRFKYVWQSEWITVVGVAGSVRRDSLSGPPYPTAYRPLRQGLAPSVAHLVVRADLEAPALGARLRGAVADVDASVPVTDVRPLRTIVSESSARARFTMLLLSGFAALALVLGAVGIYGVIAYSVTRRTREIGVRMALGADGSAVRRMVLREGGSLAALGVVLGLAGALGASRLLAGLLYGVTPSDPQVFALVPLILGAVALVATWVPAHRAAQVDPLVAIRAE